MALRREEAAEPWTQLQLLYAACDPAGFDGCRQRGEPFGQPLYVLSRTPWTDHSGWRWSRRDQALRLFSAMRPRWRRTLARLVESSDDGTNTLDAWQKEQDAAQFLRWQDKLPMTRNVPHPMWRSELVHVLAGWVDTVALSASRTVRSLDEAAIQIDNRKVNALLMDAVYLRKAYGLSKGEAAVIVLLLRGLGRRAIGVYRGVGDEGIKEQLERARKKIRATLGILSPDAAVIHMREQFRNEIKRGGMR
jgi:hypothetical protein